MTAPHQNLLGTSGAVDTGEETDPNFNQTVLLLHGDGTNGGQNNTFVDSSSSGHSITRNGNPTQGTFNPFLGEGQYSNFYDGVTGSVGAATYIGGTSSDFVFGTNEFTIEFFVYFLDNTATSFFSIETTGTIFFYDGSKFILGQRGSSGTDLEYTNTPTLNTWHHIALTRDGTGTDDIALFINGTKVANSTSNTTSIYNNSGALYIGALSVNNYSLNGYISNYRVVNGASVYSSSASSITVPSTALTAIPNTKLLTCQSNRFVDNSTSGHTISINDTPKVVPFSPLAPTASYSESVHGGSAFFDGSGDYLTIPDSSEFHLGSGDFTIETWLYITNSNSVGAGWINQWAANQLSFYFGTTTTNQFIFGYSSNGSSFLTAASGHIITNNLHQWTHFAVCRSGNNLRLFVNGTQVGSTTDFTGVTLHDSTASIVVGYNATGTSSWYLNGFMLGARILKSALYSSGSFTLPTVPPTSNSDTKLLMNFTNAEIIDSTMKSNLETVDNAQIDTSVKKFGTGSIQFDGNDSIRWNQASGTSEQMAIRTGPFTVEFFVYFDGDPNNGGTNGRASLMRDAGNSFVIQRYDGEWEVGSEPTPQIQVAQSLSNQTFYHVALTRDSSNNLRLFIDGTQAGSTSTSFTTDFDENQWHLGSFNADGSGGRALTGFMDEVRITKGVARYTSDFTAPTKAFANR